MPDDTALQEHLTARVAQAEALFHALPDRAVEVELLHLGRKIAGFAKAHGLRVATANHRLGRLIDAFN